MKWIVVAVIVMLAAPAWAEEVLYCTETDGNGFVWKKGSSEGKRTGFKPNRFIVKIISESKRIITPTTGDAKGYARNYTCRRPYTLPKHRKRIVCDAGFGDVPWIFHDNAFMRAFLSGPPVGGGDPNAFIAHGTCVKY